MHWLVESQWVNEWRYISDMHMSWPYVFAKSDMLGAFALFLTFYQWERGWQSQCFDARCSMIKNTSLRYLAYGYILCHNPALEHRHSTCQFWYLSLPGPYTAHISLFSLLLSHHHSPASKCDFEILIALFSAHTLEQGIWAPDFIHHIHQLRFVLTVHEYLKWLLDVEEQLLMAISNPCGSKGHWLLPFPCSCGSWQLPSDNDMTSSDIVLNMMTWHLMKTCVRE